jgi:hypothetical protein
MPITTPAGMKTSIKLEKGIIVMDSFMIGLDK